MTMTCREAAAFVEPFVDGELNVTDTTVFKAHVALCNACARLVERQRAWSRVVAQAPRFRAPDTLALRLRETLTQEPAPVPASAPKPQKLAAIRARRSWVAGLAVAAMLMLTASATWWLWHVAQPGATPTRTDLIARDVIDSHIRSLMADHLTDVPSSDRHTVKPWFAGKVPYALSVPDLATDGFTLEGGRLDYIAGRAVAALVYRRRQHVINLFVWPLTSDERPESDTRRRDGYDAIAWTADGQQLWAVSDVNNAELRLFVQRFQERH